MFLLSLRGGRSKRVRRMIDKIFDNTIEVFKLSDQKDIPVADAADILAETRLASIKGIHGGYWRPPWERKR